MYGDIVCYFIAFFTGKFLREKQMQCRWINFIQPEKQFHHLAYREEHGPFADIESIMDVNGIGEGIFETIRQQITVEDDT